MLNPFSQQIIESAQEGIIVLDTELRYTLWNPFMERLSGRTAAEVLGKHPWDIFPFIRERGIDETMRRSLNGELITLPDSQAPAAVAGEAVWISSRSSPLHDADGKIVGVLVFVRDITLRKCAEENLRAAELHFRALIENSHVAILLLDALGNKTYASPAITAIMGYAPDDFLKIPTFDTAYPEDRQRAMSTLAEALETPDKLISIELRILRKDGAVRWIEATAKNMLHTPGVNAIVCNISDITERKLAEQEQEKLKAQVQHAQRLESLGVLAGGIAHDFNNLLAGMLGNAELALLDLAPKAPARKRIEDMRAAGIRASELTKQMLAYAGKGKFVIETLGINDVIREMGHLLQASISKKSALKYNFASDAPNIEADAAQIRQVVMNLIINASEALGEQSGIITLSTGRIEADSRYLSEIFMKEGIPPGLYTYLEVSDTGCGMNKDMISKIFDPFYSTKFTGRGLGLSAVMGIVRCHNGAIKVYSEPGKGTSFKLLFPSTFRAVTPSRSLMQAVPNDEWRGNGVILVVDDEEMLRDLVRNSLERYGFSVLSANDGEAGLACYQAHSADIVAVILDMTMPGLSGEETFRALKRIRPDVRVLLTSGYNEQDATSHFAGKGLAGFLQKPFRISKLVEKLREITAQ